MNGAPGPTWQTCLWASLGCYAVFYVITNVLTERVIGSPKPPGSGLPVFLLGYLLVVLVAGYWFVLGYRAEFASHTPAQLAATLVAGTAAGAGLLFFFLSANRAGDDAGRQATIIGVLNVAPVPALVILFVFDAWQDGANARHVVLRIVGAVLALAGAALLAVVSGR
jgi:hypothetical protein